MHARATDETLIFAPENGDSMDPSSDAPWRVLVVDDDHEIHRVTRLVLQPFVFKDRPIEILLAYSGVEARALLANKPDISVILLDVVMETDDSGLRLVHFIREQYINRKTRIILRTGQPGLAPELRVLLDYDINDYRAKAELTAERLLTAVAVSLRSYIDIETAEQAVAQTQRAQEALLAKSTFLANMSHELRTPLNAVIGNIELLRLTPPLTPRQIDIADSAATAAHILMDVIGDVLDLSKIESDRFEVDSVETDLDLLLDEARAMVETTAAAKGLRLVFHRDPGVPRRFLTDPVRLRQVLVNLLANAVKFTPAGGVFTSVRSRQVRAGVISLRIEVVDTGIGFDPAKAETLFQPFVQGDNSLIRKYGGSGLGLAISRRIIELLGGTIGCKAIEGAGSTFWCDLPVAVVAAAVEEERSLARREVLVVGGNDTIETRLSALGASVTAVADAAAAAADSRASPFKGVVFCAGVPEPGTDWRGAKLVAVMDADDEEGVYAAHRAGADHVFRTPADAAEIAFVLGAPSGADAGDR